VICLMHAGNLTCSRSQPTQPRCCMLCCHAKPHGRAMDNFSKFSFLAPFPHNSSQIPLHSRHGRTFSVGSRVGRCTIHRIRIHPRLENKRNIQIGRRASFSQVEAEIATRRLIDLSQRLKISFQKQDDQDTVAKPDSPLESLCNNCIALSEELLAKFEKLKVQKGQKHRKFESLRHALKSVWSENAINNIAKRLNAYKEDLNAQMLSQMW
jgi:hypothetical protein